MRATHKHLDGYRKEHFQKGSSPLGASYGYFRVRHNKSVLQILSSGKRHELDGGGSWEHVSVSIYPRVDRLPTWEEMCFVKDLFWGPEETVVQFHPPESQYVSMGQVLHLWKPPYGLELPPTCALGPVVTGSKL